VSNSLVSLQEQFSGRLHFSSFSHFIENFLYTQSKKKGFKCCIFKILETLSEPFLNFQFFFSSVSISPATIREVFFDLECTNGIPPNHTTTPIQSTGGVFFFFFFFHCTTFPRDIKWIGERRALHISLEGTEQGLLGQGYESGSLGKLGPVAQNLFFNSTSIHTKRRLFDLPLFFKYLDNITEFLLDGHITA